MSENKLIKEIISKKIFAVIGSFRNEQKVAYKIFRKLTAKGYKVYPINPTMKEIDGVMCYPSLSELPEKPEVVNIVTPPQVSLEIVKQCKEIGIQYIWLQPGAENEEVIDYCRKNNLKVVYGSCIMLNT
ncbi:MAG: CoA-binding protein [Endomicrobia bacterium]|nr:CoA-binding protein [Endomicrobiia bacterium]MDW8055280.1 CoA-binding protein [Elusimicrobiota bacterium]